MLFNKKYQLEELKAFKISQKPKRSDYPIAIIDDERELAIKEILEHHDFVITHFHDIKSIKEIQGFNIIVCDIRGVGKALDSKYEGAYIVKEILKNYPQKYIIISSGSLFDIKFNDFFKMADNYLSKGADSSEWSEMLDKAIMDLNAPLFVWERTRKLLKEKNISSKVINEIEQDYIKSLIKKNNRYLQKSISKNNSCFSNEYTSFAVNSLMSFTTSLLSNLIMS